LENITNLLKWTSNVFCYLNCYNIFIFYS